MIILPSLLYITVIPTAVVVKVRMRSPGMMFTAAVQGTDGSGGDMFPGGYANLAWKNRCRQMCEITGSTIVNRLMIVCISVE